MNQVAVVMIVLMMMSMYLTMMNDNQPIQMMPIGFIYIDKTPPLATPSPSR